MTLTMEGHANGTRTEAGDLVCCSASILAYTLGQRLVEMQENRQCHGLVMKLDSGDALLAATPRNRHTDTVRSAFDTVVAGFRLLEARYPECVNVSQRE